MRGLLSVLSLLATILMSSNNKNTNVRDYLSHDIKITLKNALLTWKSLYFVIFYAA